MNPSRISMTLLCTATFLAVVTGCQSGSDDEAAPADTVASTQPADVAPASQPAGDATVSDGMLDPGAASKEQLLALPGMSAAAADALIGARPFDNMIAVDGVLAKHMSEPERAAVYARLWKPLDLNSAKGEEILLIPGVGDKMKHEFEEYRPYRGIEQFRREMGKYVDKAEVARLERYVTIR
ncbi:MAG: hypothetical protein H7Z74_03955 [Anaerolineae bacterium]|nr:hypothetical protein [Gemmatimonadaceae bacterium]